MTDSVVSALRAELTAAKAPLLPELRGLVEMANGTATLSTDARQAINGEMDRLQRRLNFIAAALDAIDGLYADGYPDLAPMRVSPGVVAELAGVQEDISAAVAIFRPISINETGDFNPVATLSIQPQGA